MQEDRIQIACPKYSQLFGACYNPVRLLRLIKRRPNACPYNRLILPRNEHLITSPEVNQYPLIPMLLKPKNAEPHPDARSEPSYRPDPLPDPLIPGIIDVCTFYVNTGNV